jgi:TolB-like protein/AraC-like DNA-binding protein/Tfp pilus assembly protein PilF
LCLNFSNFVGAKNGMSNTSNSEGDFISQIESKILENLTNEQFGVSELAEMVNMSRSNLLRKIKKSTQLSASKFIREVRLKKSMKMLKETSSSISEVSFEVGFGSTSYFIKCFREYYGYPPGEVGKGTFVTEKENVPVPFLERHKGILIATIFLAVLVSSFFIFKNKSAHTEVEIEKSIAVLPFKNESSDSSNLYFVNGLMEASLNKLQKIEDLRVISRTSVEKFRHTNKSISEIAEELDVNYLVEGSGQRVKDQVLLNIQLIEVSTDKPIWAKQYNQKVVDVFDLQNEVAKKIADAIKAKVTSAELEQIENIPTENSQAYDYYLQALPPFNSRSQEGLEEAISLFEKAIELDSQFALAFAHIAFSYYYLDFFPKEKQYTELINNNADKALLYNPKSPESLIAKALYYMHIKEYRLALPHLEKALEYNPNSSSVVNLLSSLYANYIPNTSKYLIHALKGIKLDIAANDSITKSFIYLNLSNALIQNGFIEEAYEYINKSLDYNPDNYFSPYVKAFIQYAIDKDIEQTKTALKAELQKDSTRVDILQEVAKLYYFQERYDTAYLYYEKFVEARIVYNLDIYPQEDIKIGLVYEKMGFDEKASGFFKAYADYCETDESIYKSVSIAAIYTHEGKLDEAIEQLKIFTTKSNYQYWILLFMETDPIFKPLTSHPEFKEVMKKIEDRFWKNQTQLKILLEERGLL